MLTFIAYSLSQRTLTGWLIRSIARIVFGRRYALVKMLVNFALDFFVRQRHQLPKIRRTATTHALLTREQDTEKP
jgi:hypothetical protein